MKVEVYKNLHRNRFSIRAAEGKDKGKVIGYAAEIILTTVTFKVSEAGRQRVIREGRKNVHAVIVGDFMAAIGFERRPGFHYEPHLTLPRPAMWDASRALGSPFSYNPYKCGSFVNVAGWGLASAKEVVLSIYHAPLAYGGLRVEPKPN